MLCRSSDRFADTGLRGVGGGYPASVNPRLSLTAATAVVLALAAGCTAGTPTSVTQPSPTPTTAGPKVDPAECSNVERAYNAWAGSHAHVDTLAEAEALNKDTVKWTLEQGNTLHDAVTGYTDQPAKALVVAVAEHNVELATLNAQLVIGTVIEDGVPGKVAASSVEVTKAYGRFMTVSCGRP